MMRGGVGYYLGAVLNLPRDICWLWTGIIVPDRIACRADRPLSRSVDNLSSEWDRPIGEWAVE